MTRRSFRVVVFRCVALVFSYRTGELRGEETADSDGEQCTGEPRTGGRRHLCQERPHGGEGCCQVTNEKYVILCVCFFFSFLVFGIIFVALFLRCVCTCLFCFLHHG